MNEQDEVIDLTTRANFDYANGITLLSDLHIQSAQGNVIDEFTGNAVELSYLVNYICNNTITKTGRQATCLSLLNPHLSREIIGEKQLALEELASDDSLRNKITEFLGNVKEQEPEIFRFLDVRNYREMDFRMSEAMKAISKVAEHAGKLPSAETRFLGSFLSTARSLYDSPVHRFSCGPIYRGRSGKIYGKKELKEAGERCTSFSYNPSLYTAAHVVPVLFPGTASFIAGLSHMNPNGSFSDLGALMMIGGIVFDVGSALAAYFVADEKKTRRYHNPATHRMKELGNYFDVIGVLDELIAYHEFGKSLPVKTLPDISDKGPHTFEARRLVHPVMGRCRNYVPNDISIGNPDRLTILTGPNSGGKTAIASAITLNQILGQAGCYVAAEEASISLADKIIYQSGVNQPKLEGEGGLGGQLKVSRDNFRIATDRTLYIVDDLMDATSWEGKRKLTQQHIAAMLRKRANVLYITHDSDMARTFESQRVGKYLKVEFDGYAPTHRIIPGISNDSHPELVAQRVGFDEDSIKEDLISQGLMRPNEDLMDLTRFARLDRKYA